MCVCVCVCVCKFELEMNPIVNKYTNMNKFGYSRVDFIYSLMSHIRFRRSNITY